MDIAEDKPRQYISPSIINEIKSSFSQSFHSKHVIKHASLPKSKRPPERRRKALSLSTTEDTIPLYGKVSRISSTLRRTPARKCGAPAAFRLQWRKGLSALPPRASPPEKAMALGPAPSRQRGCLGAAEPSAKGLCTTQLRPDARMTRNPTTANSAASARPSRWSPQRHGHGPRPGSSRHGGDFNRWPRPTHCDLCPSGLRHFPAMYSVQSRVR
jgi:hypothetical protein